MTVWNVPDDLVDEVGPAVASLPFVTHCYERPRHEGLAVQRLRDDPRAK